MLLESKLDNQNVFLYISFFSTVATLPLLSIELYKYGYEPFIASFTPTSDVAGLLFKVRHSSAYDTSLTGPTSGLHFALPLQRVLVLSTQ